MTPFETVVRHRRLVLVAWVLGAVAFVPGLFRLEIDNSAEGFFVRDAEEMERFRALELAFGRDRVVRLVLPGNEVWSREGLARLGTIEEGARDPYRVGGGVYGAAGPYHQHRWHLSSWPPADPEGFRDLVTSDPLARDAGWVSRDGRWVTVLAGLFEMPRERREATLEALESLLPEGGFVAGVPVVNRALDRALLDTLRESLSLLLVVVVGLLLIVFRGWAAALPLALAAVTQTILFGAMGYGGARLDVVTMILTPLVFVIALATGVHVLTYHRRAAGPGSSPGEAVLETYRVKAWPVFWAGVTTCIGFGSLAVSPVPPVRWLGLWAAFGIACMTLAALSFYPALLAVAGTHRSPAVEKEWVVTWLGRTGGILAAQAVRRRGIVLMTFGCVGLVAAAGLPRLGVETGVLGYLHREHPVRTGILALEESGVGVATASLVVSRPEADSLQDPEAVERLSEVASRLREEPLVLGAISPGDLLADVARHDPEIRPAGGAFSATLETARRKVDDTPDLASLLAYVESRGRSRILLATEMRSHRQLEPVYRRAESLGREAFPGAEVWVTGQYPLVLVAQRGLLRTMILSLSLTLAVIAVLLVGLLRSGGLAWRALVPNVWPVLVVLGAMGWSGVPVDSATMMIAAVVLGLAVDDTLHILGHFRKASARVSREPSTPGMGVTTASERAAIVTLEETAAGHATTSVVLMLGFGACAFAPFVPVARFGALAAVGIAGALAADLVLVPALLASARISSSRT